MYIVATTIVQFLAVISDTSAKDPFIITIITLARLHVLELNLDIIIQVLA
jgi:hypothetical protein